MEEGALEPAEERAVQKFSSAEIGQLGEPGGKTSDVFVRQLEPKRGRMKKAAGPFHTVGTLVAETHALFTRGGRKGGNVTLSARQRGGCMKIRYGRCSGEKRAEMRLFRRARLPGGDTNGCSTLSYSGNIAQKDKEGSYLLQTKPAREMKNGGGHPSHRFSRFGTLEQWSTPSTGRGQPSVLPGPRVEDVGGGEEVN